MHDSATAGQCLHESGCLCGRVRYRIHCNPSRTLVCHCRFCQRMTGSTSCAEALFPSDAVEFWGATASQYDHVSRGSGKVVHVHFCSSCGTTVALTFERWPEFPAISRGSREDPKRVSVGSHIRTDAAQMGVTLPANTDCFRAARATLDGQARTPQRFAAFGPCPRDTPE